MEKKKENHEGNTSEATIKFNCPAIALIQKLRDEIAIAGNGNADETVDNAEFCKRYHISAKTALHYRNNGLRFSQPSGKKIYYKVSWIDDFINKHSKEGF